MQQAIIWVQAQLFKFGGGKVLKYINGQYVKMTEEEISILENQPRDYMGEIEELKQKISALDYYFVKTSEADILGNPRPYSQEFLQEQGEIRQGYRDEINALEAEMKANG